VFVARRGRSELTTTILAVGELADLVERKPRTAGRIEVSTPFVDATLPDGSRLHLVIPMITGQAVTSGRSERLTQTSPGVRDR
jgi:pilus assembly protein CpaF